MDSEFALIPWRHLFALTMKGVDENMVFDIPENLFYKPEKSNPLRTHMFGRPLENPVGISAGPHSQMAQNIVAAWLCGARYIELKTVQTDDELDIPRPCIDMPYEGYNCEFSQELKIHQSYHEYLNAWILIHILQDKFGWTNDAGTVFNLSVGYNLEGIKKENVRWFFDKMSNSSKEKNEKLEAIADLYPRAKTLDIPDCISDNITLSTMHGCPPGEIRQIGEFLLKERGLHTYIKFNPTLLGPEKIREILRKHGYETPVPDEAFEHDIAYDEAVEVIKSLKQTAKEENLNFGLKLTNTLETRNHRDVFEGDAMFMSGKALHPVSINVARKLKNEDAMKDVPVSFSGGVDALNIAETFSCGLNPVTMSSDLLRPGGYGKISQYIDILQKACEDRGAASLDEYVMKSAGESDYTTAASKNLNRYADAVLDNPDYNADAPSIRTNRPLHQFDCIEAPCVSTCPTHQDVPGYLYHTARGEYEKAYEVIMRDNPFPAVSGLICDHECETRCTRNVYDDPVLIREAKRFVAENYQPEKPAVAETDRKEKVAVIGAGPSGLSAAYFLVQAGFQVEVFEANEQAGGVVAGTIPYFRLSDEALEKDIRRIVQMGVSMHYGTKIHPEQFRDIREKFDYVYFAIGAQNSKKLNVDGMEHVSRGVIPPIQLLAEIKSSEKTDMGKHVVVLGAGNVAMDAARTARRLVGSNGSVKLVYRRTQHQMPSSYQELKEAMEEGIEWIELANPEKVEAKDGRVASLTFQQMKIEGTDRSGRPKPVPDGNKKFTLKCDTLIPAFGQEVEPEFRQFIDEHGTTTDAADNIFVGGDAKRGGASLIKAIADGKHAAYEIIRRIGEDPLKARKMHVDKDVSRKGLQYKKARVESGAGLNKRKPGQRIDFDLVNQPLTGQVMQQEAERCMLCDEYCSICVDVCPNRANHTYEVSPFTVDVPYAWVKDGEMHYGASGTFRLQQRYQVLNIKDFCNECGNCETFCPSAGTPYLDKPQLYLTEESFSETDEGYYFSRGKLFMKKDGLLRSLQKQGTTFYYESEQAQARFRIDDFYAEAVTIKQNEADAVRFDDAVEMSVLYEAAKALNTKH